MGCRHRAITSGCRAIRDILHKYDPSGIVDRSATLSDLYHDPYQDLFDLMPYFIKARASKEELQKELRDELAYFNRTNTAKLKEFKDYEAIAAELAELKWPRNVEMKKEIIIDGNNFTDSSGFTLEIRRKFTKNVAWIDYNSVQGINLDSINDFLRGGFGVYAYHESVRVRWVNSQKSRVDLGKEETLRYLEDMLETCHPSNVDAVKEEIKMVREDKGKILFDRIIEIFQDHNYIELSVE